MPLLRTKRRDHFIGWIITIRSKYLYILHEEYCDDWEDVQEFIATLKLPWTQRLQIRHTSQGR